MNWSRTKLIFIIAFLILDLFLGTQLYQKQKNADQVESLPNGPDSEEKLKENEIGMPPDLPQIEQASRVKGEPVTFADEDGHLKPEVKKLEKKGKDKKVQKISVSSGGQTLTSKLKKARPMRKQSKDDDFEAPLKKYVYKGDEYRLWKKGGTDGSFEFVQTFHDRPVFSTNKKALEVKTEDDQIKGYRQTYLMLSGSGEQKDVIEPIKAVEKLLEDNELAFKDTVTHIELGYLNSTEEEADEVKVFIPEWHIQVQKDKGEAEDEYFVNALTGEVQTPEDEDEDSE